MYRQFTKPALSYREQVEHLRARGMEIEDQAKAEFYLEHLNYYRLRAYWIPFEAADEGTDDHRFVDGTSFDRILNLYMFDRELRLLVLDAIERIEVSVRARWAHHLATNYGAHAHLNVGHFKSRDYHQNLERLVGEVARSREVFAKHFKQTYTEPLPPIWATCELMSFGQLSRWLDSLRRPQDKHAIARTYGLAGDTLVSVIRHLSEVRNHCAHHGRLWNREFTRIPMLPKSKTEQGAGALPFRRGEPPNRRLYNALVYLGFLLDSVSPDHGWKARLIKLVNEHDIDATRMGAPEGAFEEDFWRT